jgi:hypothetical protein
MNKTQNIKVVESFHKDCLIWFSELNFWHDELSFMMDLINRYCYKLPDRDQSLELREIFNEINGTLENDIQRIKKRVQTCELNLAEIIKERLKPDLPELQNEIKLLQSDINLLRVNYQTIKKDLFVLMKSVLKEVKLEKTLDLSA